MNERHSFKSAFAQGEDLLEKNLSIDAVLVIQGGEAYLVEALEMPESLQRIPVHCPGLELQLDLNVGGWMGGAYSYLDRVKIDGKLEVGTVRKDRFVLSSVTKLTLTRDGESTDVVLSEGYHH